MSSQILKPGEKDRNLRYPIEKEGEAYLVEIREAQFANFGELYGQLSLFRCGAKSIIKWKPKIGNWLNTEKRIVETKTLEFKFRNFALNLDNFDEFVEYLNNQLSDNYSANISYKDAELFFRRGYDHYKKIGDEPKTKK